MDAPLRKKGCLADFSHWEECRSQFLYTETTSDIALIWAGGGIERQVEELILDGFGWRGAGLAAGGGGDDGEELDLGEGGAGNVEALGVGAGVGRGEEETIVVGEGVEKGTVGGGEAFKQVPGAKGEAQPESLRSGTGEKGAAGEALGIDRVGEVEVADVTNGFDVV
jgi:hypothetical protein